MRLCHIVFFFARRRRHTRFTSDWSSHVCSSDLFAARFNAERQALWSTHREKLRSLVAQAVDVLAEDMAATLEPKLRQSAAIHVLKAVGLYGQDMKPSGAIDSGQVERERQASDDLLKMFKVASA